MCRSVDLCNMHPYNTANNLHTFDFCTKKKKRSKTNQSQKQILLYISLYDPFSADQIPFVFSLERNIIIEYFF